MKPPLNKTIFITAFHALSSRNILATDVLRTLANQPSLKVIVLCPIFKEKFLNDLYGRSNVTFVGFQERLLSKYFWFKKFRSLTFQLIPTFTVKLRRQEALLRKKSLLNLIWYFGERLITFLFSRSKALHNLIRRLDQNLAPTGLFQPLIKQYRPDCIFVTDIFLDSDVLLLQAARADGIFSIGMVRSWDNTTTKGLLRAVPDKLIVNNEVIKEEAIKFHDIKAKDIFVGGIPQFDLVIQQYHTPRADFLKKIGLDPKKRMILLAPAGIFLSDTDWQICEILKRALNEKRLPSDLQFLVRSHPYDPAPLEKFQADERFVIERPGTYFKQTARMATALDTDYDFIAKNPIVDPIHAKTTEVSLQDLEHLSDSLYHSEILIHVSSTIGLDCLPFDKPQIMIDFDGWEKKNYLESVKRYHDEDHMKKYLATGAARLVESAEELIYWINSYLEKPDRDSSNRTRAAKEQIHFLDGQSGRRIGQYLLDQVFN